MNLGCEQLIACPNRNSSTRESFLDHVNINNCLVGKLNAVLFRLNLQQIKKHETRYSF